MAVIDLKPLSQEDIKELKLELNELWLVQLDQEIYGPFETTSLKNYSQENRSLFLKAKASKLDKNHWDEFYSYPAFGRSQTIDDSKTVILHQENSVWLLLKGQKSGPYTSHEIQTLMNDGTIKINDVFSPDNGETWIKLFYHPNFDRRTDKKIKPPTIPIQAAKELSNNQVVDQINHISNSVKESLTNLAYLGQKKINDQAHKVEDIKLNNHERSSHKIWLLVACFSFIAILSLGYVWMVSPKNLQIAQDQPTESEHSEVNKAVKSNIFGAENNQDNSTVNPSLDVKQVNHTKPNDSKIKRNEAIKNKSSVSSTVKDLNDNQRKSILEKRNSLRERRNKLNINKKFTKLPSQRLLRESDRDLNDQEYTENEEYERSAPLDYDEPEIEEREIDQYAEKYADEELYGNTDNKKKSLKKIQAPKDQRYIDERNPAHEAPAHEEYTDY